MNIDRPLVASVERINLLKANTENVNRVISIKIRKKLIRANYNKSGAKKLCLNSDHNFVVCVDDRRNRQVVR